MSGISTRVLPGCGPRLYTHAFYGAAVLFSLLSGATSTASASPQVIISQQLQRTGTVRDSETRRPLAGVYIISGTRVSVTDSTGAFSVTVLNDSSYVKFERPGYGPLVFRVSGLPAEVLLTPRPQTLTAITVTSTEIPVELARGSALGAVTVPKDAIGARSGTSLAERLVETEGVSIQRMGEWGSRALLRGLGGERLTVMVDGARVNRACTFGMDQGLATVDPSLVERVEILSGPGSTLYGSGNVGGVINVVTRRSDLPGGWSGELRGGTASATPGATAGGTLAWRGQRTDVSLSADGADFGDYRAPTGRVNGSGYRDGSVNLTVGASPSVSQRLTFQAQSYEGRDIGWPAMAGGTIPRESRYSVSIDHAVQLSRPFIDALSSRVYLQRLDHHMVIDMKMPMSMPDGTPVIMQNMTDARSHSGTAGGRVVARLMPPDHVHLDAGADVTSWAAEATRWTESQRIAPHEGPAATTVLRTWPAVRIVDVGSFAQGEWMINSNVAASAGVRADFLDRRADGEESTNDFVGTGNLGIRATLPSGLTTRASIGRGYRVPDPTELYGLALRPDGFIYRGNPSLAPETNLNVEASLAWSREATAGKADLALTVFRNDLSDLITPTLVPDETISGRAVRQYVNVSSARLTGTSARASASLHRNLSLRMTLTGTQGADRNSGAALAAIPPLEGSSALRFGRSAGSRWVEAEWQGASTQNRFAENAGEVRSPGYGVVNVRGSWSLDRFTVIAGVDNLFDRSYRAHVDPVRLLRPGRNAYIRVSQRFRID